MKPLRNPIGVIQRIAIEYGQDLNPHEANLLLWNHTGWPRFWHTDDPLLEMLGQLRMFFNQERPITPLNSWCWGLSVEDVAQ